MLSRCASEMRGYASTGTTIQPADAPATAPTHLPYLPGLDGVRALAVIAVLLYHADLGIYGGYLGVKSFFMLSGYLITTLLLVDIQNHGRVRLGAFWLRPRAPATTGTVRHDCWRAGAHGDRAAE